MRRAADLILASGSEARKNLLKNIGVRFVSIPSSVKEETRLKGRTPASVVELNALNKARAVASKRSSGLVIGCDTLVIQKNKIFGKPKNFAQARRFLKSLSSSPHDLYTGLAIIDSGSGREEVACEKTRITMKPLDEEEISLYFKKVFPLDKAGGFDIQGWGALFIEKIDGCYFNVVGLPLFRLNALLKTFGKTLLMMLCVVWFSGCAREFNLATGRQDAMMVSTEQEIKIGDSLSRQVEKEYVSVQDPELNDRLLRVGGRVSGVAERHDLIYRFRLIDDKKQEDLVNAFSLPGGYVYVFKKLMDVADTDDELAAVLAHEIVHIVARHGIKRLQAIWGYNILSILAVGTQNSEFAQGAQFAYLQLLVGHSREDELLCDKVGARYVRLAGYDPKGMTRFLQKLWERHKKEKSRPKSYFRTHPYSGERIKAAKLETGESISFADFINTL